jgi:hypothetical protein
MNVVLARIAQKELPRGSIAPRELTILQPPFHAKLIAFHAPVDLFVEKAIQPCQECVQKDTFALKIRLALNKNLVQMALTATLLKQGARMIVLCVLQAHTVPVAPLTQQPVLLDSTVMLDLPPQLLAHLEHMVKRWAYKTCPCALGVMEDTIAILLDCGRHVRNAIQDTIVHRVLTQLPPLME